MPLGHDESVPLDLHVSAFASGLEGEARANRHEAGVDDL